MNLLALTDEGLVRIDVRTENATATRLKADDQLQCVSLDLNDRGILYLGSRGGGVWTSMDGGATWADTRFPEADVFSLAVSPADGRVYAGTEPSKLFTSSDSGASWQEMEGLQEIPSRPGWSFPPRPWTSHVSAIAPHPENSDLLLAGIELGGLMRSVDGGETWQDHRPGAQKDVHALAWHPDAPGRAYEAGGGGAAWSRDGGEMWEPADEGRDRHYTWALAFHPHSPDVWYVSACPSARHAHYGGPANARIYRLRGTESWTALSGGLPDPLDSMPYALVHTGNRLLAGLKNGQLYASDDDGDTWIRLEVHGASLKSVKTIVIENDQS
jgi:photosystem II stability/assembly factor-like uncharacterized protein